MHFSIDSANFTSFQFSGYSKTFLISRNLAFISLVFNFEYFYANIGKIYMNYSYDNGFLLLETSKKLSCIFYKDNANPKSLVKEISSANVIYNSSLIYSK